jgi:hypothetical protein
MIQRIQTIFLFLVVVLLVTFNFLPYWQSETGEITLFSYGLQTTAGTNSALQFGIHTAVAVLSSIAALIALIEIFMFKDRLKQMMMSVINSFVLVITIGLMAYFVYGFQSTTPGDFELGMFTLAMAMFMNVLARRFIQKDENLVRSVDRIR